MMSNWKIGVKLIPYVYQAKLNIAAAIVFFVLGIVIFFAGDKFSMGGMLWMLLGLLYPVQIIFSLEYIGIVAASPKRKAINYATQDVVIIISGIVAYCITVVIEVFKAEVLKKPEDGKILLAGFILMFWLFVYLVTAYRFFILSTILFCIVTGASGLFSFMLIRGNDINILHINVIGLVLVVAGVLVNCLLRRLMFRLPISKLAVGAGLRKYL